MITVGNSRELVITAHSVGWVNREVVFTVGEQRRGDHSGEQASGALVITVPVVNREVVRSSILMTRLH